MTRRGEATKRAAVVAVALLAAGCGGEERAEPPPAPPPAARPPAPPAETAAPGEVVAFAGRDVVTGEEIDLASFRGRPTVVAIWAAWCPPCQEDGPVFARYAREHPDVAFVGIDYDDGAEAARAFIRTHRWGFPSIADPEGTLAEGRLGMRNMPTTIVLDAGHREVGRIVGATTADELGRLVRRARR